jgi:hypothetical protein
MSSTSTDVKSLSAPRARKVCEKFHVIRRTSGFPACHKQKINRHLPKSGKPATPSLRKISVLQLRTHPPLQHDLIVVAAPDNRSGLAPEHGSAQQSKFLQSATSALFKFINYHIIISGYVDFLVACWETFSYFTPVSLPEPNVEEN